MRVFIDFGWSGNMTKYHKKLTNKDVLIKALQKAQKNGFMKDAGLKNPSITENLDYIFLFNNDYSFGSGYNLKDIIFSHEFARAFWGDEEICTGCGKNAEKNYDDGICMNCAEYTLSDGHLGDMNIMEAWQHNLQEMVIYENPIDYLRMFI